MNDVNILHLTTQQKYFHYLNEKQLTRELYIESRKLDYLLHIFLNSYW